MTLFRSIHKTWPDHPAGIHPFVLPRVEDDGPSRRHARSACRRDGAVLVLVLVTLLLLSTVMLHVIQQAVDVAEEHIFLVQSVEAALQAEAARHFAVELLAGMETGALPNGAQPPAHFWEQGELRITIMPANAKLNLNAVRFSSMLPATQQRLEHSVALLLAEAASEASVEDVLDWITPEEEQSPVTRRRVESRYTGAYPSYKPRGGQLKRPEELLLVRGFGALDPAWVRERFTVWGEDGRINLNAASQEVLLALLPELEAYWPAIDRYRLEHGFARPDELLSRIRLPMDLYQRVLPSIRLDAEVFEALVEVRQPAWHELHRIVLQKDLLGEESPVRVLAADILEARMQVE